MRSVFRVSCLLSLLLMSDVVGVRPEQEAHDTLHSIASVLELSNEEAATNPQVNAVGTVTYVDHRWGPLFLTEGTRGIYVSAPFTEVKKLQFGDRVRVHGEVRIGDILPIIGNARFESLSPPEEGVSEPQLIDSSDLGDLETLDARWIELRGLVADHYQYGTRTGFVLAVAEHLVKVLPAEPIPELQTREALGTYIRVRGQAHCLKEPDLGIWALEILVQGDSQVAVLPIDENSRLGDGEKIASVKEAISRSTRRSAIVAFTGQVTLRVGKRTIFVEDETGGVKILAPADTDVSQGDFVKVIALRKDSGFPEELTAVLVRKTGTGAPPAPLKLEPEQILKEAPSNRFVQVSGILREAIKMRNSTEMRLTRNGVTYYATILENAGLAALLDRSKEVELTGVCDVSREEPGKLETFSLLVPDANGISVHSNYPFWNHDRLESTILTLIAGGLVCGLWIVTLRCRIRSQRESLVTLQRRAQTQSELLERKTDSFELQKEQLVQAQKMEAVGRLAGGIAHDFNNLLAVITGNIAMFKLDECKGTSKISHYIIAAESAAARAAELVRQMLGFSRQSTLRLEAKNVNDVVSQLFELLKHSFDKTIELEKELADDLWLVKVDSTHLEQVLLNLCVNARDAMPEGKGRITICTRNHRDRDDGDFVAITIRDNGSGMSEEVRAKIFEPFFTTKNPGKGTGLGLAMSHGIIKQHEGRIECTSQEGIGTCFSIYLPRTKESEAREEQKNAATDRDFRGNERVLVVDDETTVRTVARGVLRHYGYHVETAQDGQDALETVVSKRFELDLVLMDLTMPKMSGNEAFHRIKSIYPDLPVVICSGYLVDLDAFAREAGFRPEGFVQKPYQIDEMLATIRGAFGGLGDRTSGDVHVGR